MGWTRPSWCGALRASIASLVVPLLIAWLPGSPPAMAQKAQPRVYGYFIHHESQGRIGRHRMTVRRAGDRLIIEHDSRIAVKFLFAIAYQREAHYREVWQDGRLIAFESTTDDNGELMRVEARAEGDRLVIDGMNGVIQAPASTVPTQPSHEAAIGRRWFMKVGTGELLEGTVERAEPAAIKVAGKRIEATRYTVTGDLEHEVWFDPAGLWVKWRLVRDGGTISFTRE